MSYLSGSLGRARGVLGALGALAGRPLHPEGAVVMTYHDVGDDPENETDYYVSPTLFRQQLEWAASWGARFVDLQDLVDAVAQGQRVDGWVAVCFDDSLSGVHHHALPVLVDLGVPATLFTVSGELGRDPAWWPGAVRVMTTAEVGEWVDVGLRVASHTRTHASLPDVIERQLVDEIVGSRKELEDLVQRPVDLFAYPYGHFDRRARDVVAEAGYHCGFTFLNGRVVPGVDLLRLPRLNMWSGQGRTRLAYHLARPPESWPDHQVERFRGRTPPNASSYVRE